MGILLINALSPESVASLRGYKADLGTQISDREDAWPMLLFEVTQEMIFPLRDLFPRLGELNSILQARTSGQERIDWCRVPWSGPLSRACILPFGYMQQASRGQLTLSEPSMLTESAWNTFTGSAACQQFSNLVFLQQPVSAFGVMIDVNAKLPGRRSAAITVQIASTFCPRAVARALGGNYEPERLESSSGGFGMPAMPAAPAAPVAPSYFGPSTLPPVPMPPMGI